MFDYAFGVMFSTCGSIKRPDNTSGGYRRIDCHDNPGRSSFISSAATFALPILEPGPFKTRAILPPQSELKGFVSINDKVSTPADIVDHLVATAVARDKSKELLDRKAKFHNKKWTRLLGRSKDMLEYMTSYQGFESSSEAADVILEEKLKLKSRAAVELVKQKRLDAAHLQLTCAVMEVATGLGLTDEQKKLSAIESGLNEMIPLVGKQEADQMLESMIAWSKHLSVADSTFGRDPWDVLRSGINHEKCCRVPFVMTMSSNRSRLGFISSITRAISPEQQRSSSIPQ